jgi:hypothetical protein
MCFINFNGTKVCGHYVVKNTYVVKREKAVVKRKILRYCARLYLVPDKSCWLLAQVCNLCLANFTFAIISFW